MCFTIPKDSPTYSLNDVALRYSKISVSVLQIGASNLAYIFGLPFTGVLTVLEPYVEPALKGYVFLPKSLGLFFEISQYLPYKAGQGYSLIQQLLFQPSG